MASGASSIITMHGPDDMNSVRLAEKRALAVHRVEAFGFLLREVGQAQAADGEAGVLDAREDLAGVSGFDGVGLDDGEGSFNGHI